MAAVHRSPLAEQDYRDIWRYIAADNSDAADRLLRLIDARLCCRGLTPLSDMVGHAANHDAGQSCHGRGEYHNACAMSYQKYVWCSRN